MKSKCFRFSSDICPAQMVAISGTALRRFEDTIETVHETKFEWHTKAHPMPDANLINEFAIAIIIRNNRELIDTIAGVRLVSHNRHRSIVTRRGKWGDLVTWFNTAVMREAKSPFVFFCSTSNVNIVSERKFLFPTLKWFFVRQIQDKENPVSVF